MTKMKKLFIIFAILCLAAPAMAADWEFYGNFRMATWYQSDDFDDNGAEFGPGLDDDADLQWEGGGNSRIGANVSVNDQIGGGVEIGFDGSDLYARKIFGTYTFGNGSQLLIGKTYTPSALFYSNSVYGGDGDLLGIGEFYNSRQDMIQWKMGGFKVALIEPSQQANAIGNNDRFTISQTTGAITEGARPPEVNVILPKIEVSYGLKGDAFFLDIIGGYQTYELDEGNRSEDIDSYIGILGGGANFGALFLKASVHYGVNMGNYGINGPYVTGPTMSPTTGAAIDTAAWKATDNENLGGLLVLGFNLSEMFTIEGGVGTERYEVDTSGAPTQSLMQYYLNSTINIAPGFFIVPEVGMVTYDPDVAGAPEPERFYFGAKWQINF
jgi:hypothetical protein